MSKPYLFDSHTHVQFAAFDADRDEVIARAQARNIRMINVGTQQDTSKAAVDLAHKHEGLYAIIGLHPIHTTASHHDEQELGQGGAAFSSRGEVFDKSFYANLAADPKVVGIGECGLDYFRLSGDIAQTKQLQKEVFEKHIEVASEARKALMCHCRPSAKTDDAYEDLYEIVRPQIGKITAGVIHFFVGSLPVAKKFADLGFYFTFGGVITFARNYDEVVKYVPMDRILTETDAPYVAPEPYRGKRNEPLYVEEAAKKIAELKGIPFEQAREKIVENNFRAFSTIEN